MTRPDSLNSVRQTTPSTLLLGAASGLSPFGMAIVVPTLQSVSIRFAADYAVVQFVVSAYLFGLAIAQPIAGFMCDRFGRRPVMLYGFFLFVVASIACAFTDSLAQLIWFRVLQAIGVSVGTVASRAIVQDTRGRDGAAESLSYIAAAMGIAPVLAPMIGGTLDEYGGLRPIFLTTAGIGLIVLIRMYRHLPETLDRAQGKPDWQVWLRNYGLLLRSPSFVAYTMMFGFVQGSFFTFLAVGAAIFETNFGIGSRTFGLLWGLLAIAYVCGAILGGRATARIGARRVLLFAVAATFICGWSLLILVYLTGVTLTTLLVPMSLLMAGAGAVTPNALAGAVRQYPAIAGTSSGLSSSLGIVLSGTFSIVSGIIYTGDFIAIAGLIAFTSSMTAVSWLITHKYRTPDVA